MLTLVAALPQETAPCLKVLDLQEIITGNGLSVARVRSHRSEFLLVQGGVGTQAVVAAQFAMQHFNVTALVSFGLAGSASPLAKCGHLVIATEVVQEAGGETGQAVKRETKKDPARSTDPEITAQLLDAGQREKIVCHSGPVVTVGKVVASPQEKAFIGSRHRALALDMESYGLGKLAAEKQIPFGVARVIFDPVEMSLNIPPEVGAHPMLLWKYPRLWMELPSLTRHHFAARRTLQNLCAAL